MRSGIFFFIGTEAELIKVFPIMLKLHDRGITYYVIASGQNNICKSCIFEQSECKYVDLELSSEVDITKSAVGLFRWWVCTYTSAEKRIRDHFEGFDLSSSFMIVHGDTVSTLMGAMIGRRLGMTVCHVEAGLRSHNILIPFPEEIDRLLTSTIARIHFAPGDEAYNNLKRVKGERINTKTNTLFDSLAYSRSIPIESREIEDILKKEYFIFVMHRQENVADSTFVGNIINEIRRVAEKIHCVVLLHTITKSAFIKYGLFDTLEQDNNISLIPRVPYFDFMKLLEKSEFVITDGGSNQEELFYMNKPCLILRRVTERKEGIGLNARLFDGSASDIGRFIAEIEKFKVNNYIQSESPSEIIADYLLNTSLNIS